MLTELEKNFARIEDRILIINKGYKELSKKYAELLREQAMLQKKYEEEREKNHKLLEENKELKLFSSISGNPEHNKLMKSHINRLIKEIDACIAQLQNSGM